PVACPGRVDDAILRLHGLRGSREGRHVQRNGDEEGEKQGAGGEQATNEAVHCVPPVVGHETERLPAGAPKSRSVLIVRVTWVPGIVVCITRTAITRGFEIRETVSVVGRVGRVRVVT